MISRTTIALVFLAMAPAAQALEITDDTPARAITILKDQDAPRRVLISPQVVSMGECKSEIIRSAAAGMEGVIYAMCVPADMTTEGNYKGEAPIIDLS